MGREQEYLTGLLIRTICGSVGCSVSTRMTRLLLPHESTSRLTHAMLLYGLTTACSIAALPVKSVANTPLSRFLYGSLGIWHLPLPASGYPVSPFVRTKCICNPHCPLHSLAICIFSPIPLIKPINPTSAFRPKCPNNRHLKHLFSEICSFRQKQSSAWFPLAVALWLFEYRHKLSRKYALCAA